MAEGGHEEGREQDRHGEDPALTREASVDAIMVRVMQRLANEGVQVGATPGTS